VVAGEWMNIKIFENSWHGQGSGLAEWAEGLIDSRSPEKKISGLWQCLVVQDFDGDGDNDIVAGNIGLNTPLRKNGSESVVRMYPGDFDDNDKNDQIVAWNRPDGKFYPAASLEDLSKQLPSLTGKFPASKDLSGLTVEKLFDALNVPPPQPVYVDQFASVYLENAGENHFIVSQLPVAMQTSKIYSMATGDFNNDGHVDIIAGGNFSGASNYQGNYDASRGVMLAGNGTGNFKSIKMNASGLNLDGHTRDIKMVNTNAGRLYLVSKNNGQVQTIKKRSSLLP
jgi:hypothetical protein